MIIRAEQLIIHKILMKILYSRYSADLIRSNAGENTKRIRDGALSRSFVTGHYPFLFYRNYEIASYACPEKILSFPVKLLL